MALARKRRPVSSQFRQSPFISADDGPIRHMRSSWRVRLADFGWSLAAILVVFLVPVALLVVALIAQATWSPVVGGIAALVILLLLAISLSGLGSFF